MERVLETIVERSRPELEETKRHVPASELRRRIADAPPVRDFTDSLRKPGLRVIAELKAASPSKGVIRQPLEVEALAAELETAGAAALSVLTERNFFLGGLENLTDGVILRRAHQPVAAGLAERALDEPRLGQRRHDALQIFAGDALPLGDVAETDVCAVSAVLRQLQHNAQGIAPLGRYNHVCPSSGRPDVPFNSYLFGGHYILNPLQCQ